MTASKSRRWYLATPPLYLVIIAGLLYLQFGGLRQTTDTLGEMEVRTTTSRDLLGRERVRDVAVRFAGLRVALGATGPVTLRDETGAVERLWPTGTQITGTELVVILGNRLELHFQGQESRFEAYAIPLASLPFPVAVSIPFRIESTSPVSSLPGLPVLSTRDDGCTLYVSGDDGATMDSRHVTRILDTDNRALLLRAEPCTQIEDPYEYWFRADTATSDEAAYSAAVADLAERSWPAWQARVWAEGADLLSQETLVLSYLAQTLVRGGYGPSQAQLQSRIAGQFRANTAAGMRPAAYLGFLPSYLAAGRARAAALIQEVTTRTGQEDHSVFSTPDLLATVLNHGATTLVDRLLALGARLPVATADLDDLLGLARFYLDVDASLGQMDGVRVRLEDILYTRVVPSLRRTPSGTFLLPDPAAGDRTEGTFRAALLLQDAAVALDRPSLVRVGRALAISALSLASGDGSLPTGIRLVGGKLVKSAETISPEEIYTLLQPRYLPRERPLPTELGNGNWLLSAAEIRDLASEGGSLRFSVGFPPAQTHYLVLQGVPEIRGLSIHGIPWRGDPEYYLYSDGWWYSADTRTLYIKCTQQQPWEVLSLQLP